MLIPTSLAAHAEAGVDGKSGDDNGGYRHAACQAAQSLPYGLNGTECATQAIGRSGVTAVALAAYLHSNSDSQFLTD